MSFDSFTRFTAQFCKAARIDVPVLAADADGLLAFNLHIRDVVVDVVHPLVSDGGECEDVFVLVGFGAMPEDDQLEVLRALAEANFCMMGQDAPVYGVNPDSGEVVLRRRIDLSRGDAAEALAMVLQLTQVALQWRADPHLSGFTKRSLGVSALAGVSRN